MTELLAIIAVIILGFIVAIFAFWTAFCFMLKGMFKIADKIFGV